MKITLEHKQPYSNECLKTKTKALTNHKRNKKQNKPIDQKLKQIQVMSLKRGKTRANKSRLVLVFLLIG